MFRIQVQVGPRFGGWATGGQRFSTAEDAKTAIDDIQRGERKVQATVMTRRVVSA